MKAAILDIAYWPRVHDAWEQACKDDATYGQAFWDRLSVELGL